jgi:hypothetical protein
MPLGVLRVVHRLSHRCAWRAACHLSLFSVQQSLHKRKVSSPWTRRSVSGHSTRRFNPSPVSARFVVDKMALLPTDFSPVTLFSSVIIIPPVRHIYLFVHHRRYLSLAIGSIVKQHRSVLPGERLFWPSSPWFYSILQKLP